MNNSKSPAVNWSYKNSKGNIVLDFNPVVFLSTTVLIALFVVLSLMYLDEFSHSVDGLQAWIANQTGWFFVLMVNTVLGYLIFLMIGPYGGIRLGQTDERPEFSRTAWFAMLFSAGMGIGLMFYSVAEPLSHLAKSPHGVAPGGAAAYQDSIKTTSDSGSLVIDIITAGGHPNPPVAQRIYWATTEGVVAAILLAGGGLLHCKPQQSLQGYPLQH